MADRAAVLIAVETFYEVGPPIPYAANDCAELLRTLPAAGYNPAKCFLIAGTRTTKAAIESHLARLPKLIDRADSLLVLFVTRGFSHMGRGYLACADTITPDPVHTSIAAADLLAAIHKTDSKDVAVLLDVDPLTLPGELFPSGLDETELRKHFESSPACVGLLSTIPCERSYESAELRRGIWRHHLIEVFSGKRRRGVQKNGSLSAAALHDLLADAVPRTLRRSYDTQEQTPLLLNEANAGITIAELGKLLGAGNELLSASRMKRVVFRAESTGRVKDLSGYRKSHTLPERANEWARKYVNRIAAADIRSDLDDTFAMIRDVFGYKRKDLDVSAERDGLGFIRTPDFEYIVSVEVNPQEPNDVIWRRELGRLSGPEFVRSENFRQVFRDIFNKLVFEFLQPVDVAEFVDRIEDAPLEGVKVRVASDSDAAVVSLTGFSGSINVTRDAVIIEGRTGDPASLLEQFLAFLRKFGSLGEPRVLTG